MGDGGGGAYVAWPDGDPLAVLVHPGDDDGHAPRTLHPQHVGLLDTRGSEVTVVRFGLLWLREGLRSSQGLGLGLMWMMAGSSSPRVQSV